MTEDFAAEFFSGDVQDVTLVKVIQKGGSTTATLKKPLLRGMDLKFGECLYGARVKLKETSFLILTEICGKARNDDPSRGE